MLIPALQNSRIHFFVLGSGSSSTSHRLLCSVLVRTRPHKHNSCCCMILTQHTHAQHPELIPAHMAILLLFDLSVPAIFFSLSQNDHEMPAQLITFVLARTSLQRLPAPIFLLGSNSSRCTLGTRNMHTPAHKTRNKHMHLEIGELPSRIPSSFISAATGSLSIRVRNEIVAVASACPVLVNCSGSHVAWFQPRCSPFRHDFIPARTLLLRPSSSLLHTLSAPLSLFLLDFDFSSGFSDRHFLC